MTCARHPAAAPAGRPRPFPLRIPILLLWLLLLPFALFVAPLVLAACLVLRVNPFRAVAAFWQLFSGLRGVRVAVERPGAAVSIRIS